MNVLLVPNNTVNSSLHGVMLATQIYLIITAIVVGMLSFYAQGRNILSNNLCMIRDGFHVKGVTAASCR